ncbi:hypothetical protein H6504_01190 [Candidatus Woesearchaeota archaeon]|nr:hypothetical protein [Candidatus Woesearchaeota archaeon]
MSSVDDMVTQHYRLFEEQQQLKLQLAEIQKQQQAAGALRYDHEMKWYFGYPRTVYNPPGTLPKL